MRYFALLLPLLLTACASGGWGNGRVAIATVGSNGQEFGGANCVVTNNAGGWNVTTPATLEIGRASGELRIVCNKLGYRTSELRLPPYTQRSGSNVGVGLGGGSGAVGLGLGITLPLPTGGGSYPARVVVNMYPQ